jgi:Methyltransferase domain
VVGRWAGYGDAVKHVIKRAISAAFAKAGYSILRTDDLERERAAGDRQRGVIDQQCLVTDEQRAATEQQDPEEAVKIEMRPLQALADHGAIPSPVDRTWATRLVSSEVYSRLVHGYFQPYPAKSLVSCESRAFLYLLARAMRPTAIAEIGTYYAGTSEVLARALWENGAGLFHTADPFGGERCPVIIRQWPEALQKFVQYYDMNSMEFFSRCEATGTLLDIVFIDGNHELEYALYDLQMAARLIRPRGVIVLDNSDLTGPFWAARRFVELNPDWCELGNAIEDFRLSTPFANPRASVADTKFVVLQAPPFYAIGEVPRSWGHKRIESGRVEGFRLDLDRGAYRGRLHFQLTLRSYGQRIDEHMVVGTLEVDMSGDGNSIEHRLPVAAELHGCADAVYTLETELAWEPAPGCGNLRIMAPPRVS